MTCPRLRTLIAIAAAAAWLAVSPGCVTVSEETSVTAGGASKTRQKRPASPRKPPGLEPQVMMLSAGAAHDTDANGYVDTIPVVVYLFGDPTRYALPIEHEGDFAFRVQTKGGRVLGTWNFLGDQAQAGAQELPPGPGYAFGLRLREGRDRMSRTKALITGRFRIEGTAREIRTTGATEILLGSGAQAAGGG